MPCAGPSEYELQEMEAQANKEKFGKYWTNEEMYKNVACAFGKRMYDPNTTTVPAWAAKWWQEHVKEDALKAAEEKQQAHEKRKREEAELEKLARKLGKKVV